MVSNSAHACTYLVLRDVGYGYGVFRNYFLANDCLEKDSNETLKKEVKMMDVEMCFDGECLRTPFFHSLMKNKGVEAIRLFTCSMEIFSLGWDAKFCALRLYGSLNREKFKGYFKEILVENEGKDCGETSSFGRTKKKCLSLRGIFLDSTLKNMEMEKCLASCHSTLIDSKACFTAFFEHTENFDFTSEVRGDCLVGLCEKSGENALDDVKSFSFCVNFNDLNGGGMKFSL
jgi:hypothetical protein